MFSQDEIRSIYYALGAFQRLNDVVVDGEFIDGQKLLIRVNEELKNAHATPPLQQQIAEAILAQSNCNCERCETFREAAEIAANFGKEVGE